MKIIQNIIFIFLAIMGLSACLPDPLPVDGVPVPEDQVVVGNQIAPDRFLLLSLTRNFTALQGGDDSDIDSLINAVLIPNVDIQVRVEGGIYPLEEIARGLYGSVSLPQIPGATYALSFTNPFNQQPTYAETTLLPSISFSSVSPSLRYTEFDTLMTVDFSLQDPEGPNWYMLNVQEVSQDIDLAETPFTELLSDEEFDGEFYEGSFDVFFRDFSREDTVLISIANISKDYYDFLDLRNDQAFLLLDGLGEPVNYESNVENGLGLFNLYIPDIRFFELENVP